MFPTIAENQPFDSSTFDITATDSNPNGRTQFMPRFEPITSKTTSE